MSWQKDLSELWEGNATVRRAAYSIVILGLGYSFWVNYEHDIKRVAIGVLILAGGLLEETTWYFRVILIGTYLCINSNWKSSRRHEETIKLLSEIRDRLNSR